MCKNIANDYVIEMDPESDRKWVKRMTTFEGAMNTDINFQNIMDDKAAEPDKPPSVDVLKIRWTCENILEDVSRSNKEGLIKRCLFRWSYTAPCEVLLLENRKNSIISL